MPDSLTANLTQYPLAKTEFDGYASAAILTFLFFVLNKDATSWVNFMARKTENKKIKKPIIYMI